MQSVLDILRRIDADQLTPEAALREAWEAIRAGDGDIRAFVHIDENAAAGRGGLLRGIAVGVKDIIDTADCPTEMGSPIYEGWRPKADAPVVAALKRAGGSVVGKTATTPFAFLDPAATRNPRNLEHTPGGSSAGSAAAVAGGLVPLAIGTQTGGSVIRPASFCGVAAIKPSFRLIPTAGVKCFSWTLDTVGLFAATVADTAYALAAITGRPDLRVDDRAVAPPRIGIVAQDFAGEPGSGSAAALARAAELAMRAGASVRTVSLPPILGEAFEAHGALQDFEARQAFAWEYDHRRDDLPPLLRGLLDAAQHLEPRAYDDARRTAHRARQALDGAFGDVDVLLTVSAADAAPRGLGSTGDSRFNRLWTLMGSPCVNVPGLAESAGMPVGVQVIARFGRDAGALAAARFIEDAIRTQA